MSRIIDTCCLINLYTAGDLHTLLPPLGGEWHVVENVVTETRYARRPDPLDASKTVRVPLDLNPALSAGVLRSCTASEDELALFVELAVALGDGEAMCLAIAQNRGWTLASDDRQARRVASERGVPLLCTPQILKLWAMATAASEEEVDRVLLAVQTYARFVPHSNLPDVDWWEATLRAAHP